ncbi:hypothetical protein [Gallaecimonas sp. GXIMD4217]|uniref:hypothetical protein n=1 Tax=Gallaecimonas sp. GXIMD4217 TaxID=3131927 RepID=UPI00311B1205
MKQISLLILLLLLAGQALASELSQRCAEFQTMLDRADASTRAMMKEQMADLIAMCAKEDTAGHKKAMASGPLHCRSGDLCASYNFSHAADRKIYEPGCAQVTRCPSGYSDSCSLKNDKVRGGKGTVDWTIYAYNGLVRDKAQNLKCD